MHVTLFSFGFKHGPAEADTVFDMRFLPNPYYVPELKNGTGLEQEVAEYVMENELACEFFKLFATLLSSYIENHHHAGRDSLTIAFGCTGGRHRSVAVTEHIGTLLNETAFELTVFHRDIEKE